MLNVRHKLNRGSNTFKMQKEKQRKNAANFDRQKSAGQNSF